MGKPKSNEKKTKLGVTIPVRPGYEKRYFVDNTKTESFTNYHTALGAKGALEHATQNDDVRIRLRLRPNGYDLVVKVAKEVKLKENNDGPVISNQTEVLQTQTASVAPQPS